RARSPDDLCMHGASRHLARHSCPTRRSSDLELRARLGRELSDEEFLLRATMPATQVDAMRAAGPAARHYDPESKPVMELLRRVLKLRGVSELSVVESDFKLELRGGAGLRAPPELVRALRRGGSAGPPR